MTLEGCFPNDTEQTEKPREEPICRESIPPGNFWLDEGGACILPTLTAADIVWILQHNPQAKKDYLAAINPKRADYTVLVNTLPLDPQYEDNTMKSINNQKAGVSVLYGHFRGIPPQYG